MSAVDSVSDANLVDVGEAPSLAMSMTYTMMADSIGLLMENAVAHQQRSQLVSGAALVQVLAMIIKAGTT